MVYLTGLNDAENARAVRRHRQPGRGSSWKRRGEPAGAGRWTTSYLRTRTPAEYEIELKLDKPISIEFNQTPLEQAIDNLQEHDQAAARRSTTASLDAEGISAVKPITVKPGTAVSTRNILSFTLEQAGLSYVVENDLVKITTTRKAKGRLFTKVFSVADLVTPIPNFALPDYANFDKMLQGQPAQRRPRRSCRG